MGKRFYFPRQTFLSSDVAQVVDDPRGPVQIPHAASDVARLHGTLDLPIPYPGGSVEASEKIVSCCYVAVAFKEFVTHQGA